MSAIEFLGRLRGLGVTLTADGEELRCRAPHGVLTPPLLAELRQRKRELLVYLGDGTPAGRASAPAIPRAARDGALPLSFGQQRLWFLDRLTPGNPAYNVSAAAWLTGPLDVGALQQSMTAIANRHDVLRTVFHATDGVPRQVVLPPGEVPLPIVDLSGVGARDREAQAHGLARQHASRPFDLGRGPLFRAGLVRVDARHHALLLSMHHAVADGWSLGVLVRELAAAYVALADGKRPRLPELPIQYADYAAWQRQQLSGAALERLTAYWHRQLAGSAGLPQFGTRRPRAPAASHVGAKELLELSQPLTQALVALSRRDGNTLFMTLMTAVLVLLARYTGERDVLVGFPIANRTNRAIEPLIGFFANTLVLRQDVGGNPTFRALAARVRETALDAFTHQDMPFDHLTETLRPDRGRGENPLFPVMFAMQGAWLPSIGFAGLRLRPMAVENHTAKFDLNITLAEIAGSLRGFIQYRADRFTPADASRMAVHFRTLLAGAAAAPDTRIHALPLLTERERRELVAVPARPAAHRGRLDEAFDVQAMATPARAAVTCDGAMLTYRELQRRANGVAARLRALGVGPDVPVGIYLERSVDLITAILATFKAGGAYLPLDPAAPPERLAFMLADAAPRAMLTQSALAARLPANTGDAVICLDTGPDAREDETPAKMAGSPDALAYLIYTSGSTGAPKAVAISHRSVGNLVHALHEAIYAALGPGPLAVGVNGPVTFDTSVKQIVQIVRGHTLHILPDALRADPHALLSRLRRDPLDVLDCTPSQLRLLVAAGLLEEPACASMTVLVGGEAIDTELWSQVTAAAVGRFYNLYGPTECTVDATACRIEAGEPTIGRPLANVGAYVLDGEGQPVPLGTAGELYIGGAGVGRGYHNRPALTAEAFRPDPFAPEQGARMYRTRDTVRRLDTGDLEFVGRVDRLRKVRGHRVELGEIEQALRRHSAVGDAAVVVRAVGPGDDRLLAYVVPSSTAAPPVGDLRRFLRDTLPAYMVPVEYVLLDAMPMNEHGKTDYLRLPHAGIARIARAESAGAPRDLIELELARIWAELLRVHPIDVSDNFFDLGGHSLLAVLMLAKIKERCGRELPLSALFAGATIEQLAALLRHGSTAPWSPLVALQPGGAKRPFFCVHPVGGNVVCYFELAGALGSDQPFFGLQAERIPPGGERQSVATMASTYVAEVRKVQPRGPYRLGGWSMGGCIAFEMARQLVAAGERIELLALIDSRAPGPHRGPAPAAGSGASRRFAADLAARAGKSAAIFDAIWSAPGGDRDAGILDVAIAQGVLPPGVDLQHLRDLLHVFRSNLRAERAYRPPRTRLGLTLIHSAQSAARWGADPTFGWGALTDGAVHRQTIPGTHYSIMRAPHVEALAHALAAALGAAGEADAAAAPMFETAPSA